MAFPISPSNNQQATVGGITYTYSTATNSWTRVQISNPYPWQRVTGTFSATNNDRLICDTDTGSFNVTLPASPQEGYYVVISDNQCAESVVSNTATISTLTDFRIVSQPLNFQFVCKKKQQTAMLYIPAHLRAFGFWFFQVQKVQ